MIELKSVRLTIPENSNIIFGQRHFIKTVEDLYEAVVNTSAHIQFGIAFCEASGDCLFCATANPVEAIVAETEQGRGVLGVIDGSSPKGVETPEDAMKRIALLNTFGYKR